MSDAPKTREWVAIASLLISAGSIVFSAGVVYTDVRAHEVRISKIEDKVDSFAARIERIDANVEFLAEQAREQRARAK